jgi:hypothetical protein
MSSIASAPAVARGAARERVSWRRLTWVAPLTVIAAAAICLGLRGIVQTVNPELAQMPQLGMPMLTLAIDGAVAAVVVFILFALFVPRAIFWFRIVGFAVLAVTWIPDIALGLGGTPMRLAMRYVSPLTSLGAALDQGTRPQGPPPGAQTGGPPPAFLSGLPMQQVMVLMLLHAAVAVVCIGMLTILPIVREKSPSRPSPSA